MLSANGTIFSYEQKAVVPGLLERWYAERKELQAKKKESTTEEDKAFWDKRQLVKKINLNSLYGAILNPGCRFFDKRIGQSTTLTGRIIAKHMDAYINECITGEYDHTGPAIIYGDTPSGLPRQQDKLYSVHGICPTLATFSTPAFDHPKGWRILTPVECLRLQSFPDSHPISSKDSLGYKQTGNAVNVKIVKSIIDRIIL